MDRISCLEAEIAALQKDLHSKEQELYQLKTEWAPFLNQPKDGSTNQCTSSEQCEDRTQYNILPKWAIERYSRQILLPEIGVPGQGKLCKSRVLVVGAGGLGCPAALYLAGAGVGEIGIVDYDTVDLTNLHRQILHGEKDQGINKVDSAAHSLRNLNSRLTITPYNIQLDSTNALEIASKYDVVLDCTDNVPTRYLLNDACVLTRRPLISGSALKMEGQITIYGHISENGAGESERGPCYRCVFPAPPPAETVGSCSASGVAGPVPGVIGALQALEAIKLIVGHPRERMLVGRMLLMDGEDMTFRTVKLRGQDPQCAACSKTPTITQLVDYEAFCRAQAKEKDIDLRILPPHHRTTPSGLAAKLSKSSERPLLVDVRNENEFRMCSIDGAVNFPIELFGGEKLDRLVEDIKRFGRDVIFICRRGNDSQIAAKKVIDALQGGKNDTEHPTSHISDLCGGLHAWAKEVDSDFPVY